MNYIINQIKEEPVAFQGLIQVALALGLSFGLNLSNIQVGAILAFSAAVLAFLTRKVVSPVAAG